MSPSYRMDNDLLKSLLSRLSRYAFETFVAELFGADSCAEPFTPLPEAGEGVYFQRLLDSYGGSLHTVFILHYSPLELFSPLAPKAVGDPILIQRLRSVRQLYKGKIGYWGMVAPSLKKADCLQSMAFITNLHSIDRDVYKNNIVPQYSELAQKVRLKKPDIFVGSYDSFIELTPDETTQAFQRFITRNNEGLCISLNGEQASVEKFSTERNLAGGVLRTTKFPYEPVFINHIRQKEASLAEFESLIRKETPELELERFIVKHYQDIFGSKYDRIETQLWLRFPELDVSGRERRLDVFLRNSVINDWELFEIKRVIDLSCTYRDAPVISKEVTYAIQQIKNYARILSQDSVKRYFAQQGIEYYEPTLNMVIGRTPQIPHEQWRWLLSNEKEVKILTFDNLLKEMKSRLRERYDVLV